MSAAAAIIKLQRLQVERSAQSGPCAQAGEELYRAERRRLIREGVDPLEAWLRALPELGPLDPAAITDAEVEQARALLRDLGLAPSGQA